jgi:chromosome segregation ATPase
MFTVLFTGCIGKKVEEEIYHELEKVVSLENEFAKQQQPMVELERKEKELYGQIMKLGMKEFDKIVQLSKEAIDIIHSRKEHLQRERESMNASKKQFTKIEKLIERVEKQKLKDTGNNLVQIMNRRYEEYDKLYHSYLKALQYDEELYQMLQNKDITLEQLEAQIEKINQTYEQVMKANKEFNKLTEQYNETKLIFYENAGLKVSYQKENQ